MVLEVFSKENPHHFNCPSTIKVIHQGFLLRAHLKEHFKKTDAFLLIEGQTSSS